MCYVPVLSDIDMSMSANETVCSTRYTATDIVHNPCLT